MHSEETPVRWIKAGRKYKEKRDVQRTRLTSYETEGERLKAEAERRTAGSPEIGSARLSDLATAILESGD